MVSAILHRFMRIALGGAPALLLVGAAGLFVQAWQSNGPIVPELEAPTPVAGPTTEHATERPLSWYAPLWERNLRQPLFEPTAATESAPAPPPELPLLVGTIVEPGRSFAHLRTRDGRTVVKPVRAIVESYEVMAIESGRVQLRHGNNDYWVCVPRPNALRSRENP